MTSVRAGLARSRILAFRRRAGGLDERLPPGPASLRRAAWAALLSIHARVAGAEPTTWADPSLVQLWGPRFNVFVVAARDLAVFSLGTLPEDAKGRRRAEDLAARLHAVLGGPRMGPLTRAERDAVAAEAESLPLPGAKGRIVIRWDE